MLHSPKFIWAVCLATFALTMFLVAYTSTQTFNVQLRFNITPINSTTTQSHTGLTKINKEKGEEKFITFLPHSGLHNQRIGLINAMILAKALNRTLILPQINIGKAIGWKPSLLSEARFSECTIQNKRRSDALCKGFNKYVPVSVESIFDLSALHDAGVRTIQRDDMSQSYFQDVWSIPDEEVYRVEDLTRFSYRIYDSKKNQDSMRSFEYRIDMDDLREMDEKVIVFGSLHYTMRLALEDPYLVWFAQHLRKEISISHPVVIRQALRIIPLLGGPDKFVGVHLRQGDGYFKALMDETLNTLRLTLEQTDLSPDQILQLQQNPDFSTSPRALSPEDQNKLTELHAISSADKMQLLSQCVAWHKPDNHPRLRLIYMATDTPSPRTTLKELYDEFPCIFTLSDFPEVIESTLTMSPMLTGNARVDDEMMEYGTKISPLLFPMIDAEIASHGSTFIGTRKSTFSQYINHRYTRFKSIYNNDSQ
ncbi:MAG: hypothetical protein EXX96DRAFT_580196 [Benjaminiella poitrasii]|nr:MAG: hypothetical protein EXX96DRAFT_580196 [Benjaminiella poitrasii]